MTKALTHLDKILNLPDPMLTFKWVARAMPFELPPEYVEAVDLPFMNIGISEGVYTGGRPTFYPGTATISSFNLTLYEDRKGTALKWINAWKLRVRNLETGDCGLPIDYKRDIVVTMLDQKNISIVTARLKGCFPADLTPLNLNYTDGSGRITHQLTVSVDNQELTFHT